MSGSIAISAISNVNNISPTEYDDVSLKRAIVSLVKDLSNRVTTKMNNLKLKKIQLLLVQNSRTTNQTQIQKQSEEFLKLKEETTAFLKKAQACFITKETEGEVAEFQRRLEAGLKYCETVAVKS